MATELCNKKLLELLYFLVTHQKFMNSVEIAKHFKLSGNTITDRTLRRWFRQLRRPEFKDNFKYYFSPNCNVFGLKQMLVILSGLKDEKLLGLIPYNIHNITGINFQTCETCIFAWYTIPCEHIEEFKDFWKAAASLVSSYAIFECEPAIYMYRPFHEAITEAGNLELGKKIDPYFLNLLSEKLKIEQAGICPEVKTNPLLVPVLLEYFKENWSSRDVWASIKKKLGEKVWNYIENGSRKEGVGIYSISKTLKQINDNFEKFVRQTRVFYAPLERHRDGIPLWLFIKIEKSDILEFVSKLFEKTLITAVCPSAGEITPIFIITTSKEFAGVLNLVKERSSSSSILLVDVQASAKYWSRETSKLDHALLFDPEKCEWIYENEKYLQAIRELYKS